MSQTETRPPLDKLPLSLLTMLAGMLELQQKQIDDASTLFTSATLAPYVPRHTMTALREAALASGWAAELLRADALAASLPRYG